MCVVCYALSGDKKEANKMKIKKENQTIKIEPTRDKFILSEHKQFINDSPKTMKALFRLYNRGFKNAYIDFKMLLPILL